MRFHCLSGISVAALTVATTVGVVLTPSAQAVCLGSTSVCSRFDPASPSPVSNFSGFTGTGNVAATYTKAKIRLTFTGSPVPQTFTGFTLAGQGINTVLNFGNLTVTTSGTRVETSFQNLDTSVSGSSLNFANNSISFTIPAASGSEIALGSTILVDVQYSDTAENNINTTAGDFNTIADDTINVDVPGPLPALGAAAAFRYSRRLRSRINASKKPARTSNHYCC